ncbi:uncharacterized protein LOC116413802 [Galleria mellonella]|uniref:Uncharacterized protein LOC116413802 n=1 Tax=Galleria mellonella TaxID=7137 RepID=A0ABM3N3N8_GALME|nr:uncharacterized protein LOC116413802 [Galleria mellonella]
MKSLIWAANDTTNFYIARNEVLFLITCEHIDVLKNVAGFNDAQHRGHKWHDSHDSSDSESDDSNSDMISGYSEETSSDISSETYSSSDSSDASSAETKERRRATQAHRVCTPCLHDMMKKHKNIGIKWICSGYQRARRSFKSDCMMRYRICQDGTLFVKLYDHRCKNDSYHGRHWFYVYRV